MRYHFHHPLFLSATHMLVSYVVAAIMVHRLGMVPANRRTLTFSEQLRLVVPFSLLGAASIGASNFALVYLYPSLNEMLQTTTPVLGFRVVLS